MKRMHIHLGVRDLNESVCFYSALFAAEPTVLKDDYAKWMLEDPKLNFALSSRSKHIGLDHLGFQAETPEALDGLRQRLEDAALPAKAEIGQACCYARSDKHWTIDPQGIAWESFYTLSGIPTFNCDTEDASETDGHPCCAPKSATIGFKSRS